MNNIIVVFIVFAIFITNSYAKKIEIKPFISENGTLFLSNKVPFSLNYDTDLFVNKNLIKKIEKEKIEGFETIFLVYYRNNNLLFKVETIENKIQRIFVKNKSIIFLTDRGSIRIGDDLKYIFTIFDKAYIENAEIGSYIFTNKVSNISFHTKCEKNNILGKKENMFLNCTIDEILIIGN